MSNQIEIQEPGVIVYTMRNGALRGWKVNHDGDLYELHPDDLAFLVGRGRAVNPDCVQGKHDSCAGDAWDEAADERVECSCACHRR